MTPRETTIGLVGDVMLGRLVDEAIAGRGVAHPWDPGVVGLFRACDAVVGNLECCIAPASTPQWEPFAKTFHFRLDPAHAETLLVPGFSALTLANNHTLDHGVEGLRSTLAALDALGIPHAGAGETPEDAFAPARFRAGALRVAVVSVADHLAAWDATRGDPGIAYLDVPPTREQRARLEDALAAARQGADFVLLAIHWGPNMRRYPTRAFEAFAEEALGLGADALAGTSAHLPQGVAWHGGKPVLFDLGDFVDDYAVDPLERNDRSFFWRLRLANGRTACVEALPVRIGGCRVRLAPADDAAWCASVLDDCCGRFGTRVSRQGDSLRMDAAPADAPRR